MPTPLQTLHITNSAQEEGSKRFLRRARETYVASRIRKVLKEEGMLMLDFDSAPDAQARMDLSAALCRIRNQILAMIGWPKPPTMKGSMPQVLAGLANHSPLSDLDVSSMPDATPGAEPGDGDEVGK